MDRSEPQVQTNSSQLNNEASAARRLFNATGNFFKSHKNEAVATLAAATLTLTLTACGETAKAEGPAPTTTQSAEATPTETAEPTPVETEAPTEVTPESLRIPADLPAEELAEASASLWQEWIFSGATEDVIDETKQEARDFEGDYADFLVQKAHENADLYAEAYLVDGWENDPQLVTFYDSTVETNREMIEIALHRQIEGEPFIKVTETVSNVIEVEPSVEGERIIKFDLNGTIENSDSSYVPGSITNYYNVTDGTARLAREINIPHQ